MKTNNFELIFGERGYLDNSPVLTQSYISIPIDICESDKKKQVPNTIIIDVPSLENKMNNIKYYDSETGKITYFEKSLKDVFSEIEVINDIVSIKSFSNKTFLPLFIKFEKNNELTFFSRLRVLNGSMLFIFSGEVADEKISEVNLLELFNQVHRKNALFLNNHQCYYKKLFKGEEVEYKYTLPNDIDIWALIQEFYSEIKSGKVPFFVPEFGDEFQSWDYENYLYEISQPKEEAGYISFIPLSKGGYTIKRKWFLGDQLKRREEHYHEPQKIKDFKKYIEAEFNVNGIYLPSFQRIRYDVNFESLQTGHVFGLYFDYSYLHSDKKKVLCQCELEYIRTRSIKSYNEEEVLEQLNELAEYMDNFFKRRNIPTARGVYSKLSFLKDSMKEGNYE